MNHFNLILVLLLIHYAGVLLTKRKNNILACGLFAWAGKDTDQFNPSMFNILGIMNETRGKHSCGVSTDGEIYSGVNDGKIYRDFIATTGYKMPTKFPTVIGHTRHSTVGTHSLDNAHPFGFGYNEKHSSYQFIGVHNGTLLNHKDLAKTNKIEPSRESVEHKTKIVDKIDSEIILECIYNNENYKVLSEYNGAAALIFTNVNEPNVIYCYHGASKKYTTSKSDDLYIERPLFYYKESKTSLYISSIDSSLTAIGAIKDKSLGEFECNVVYKIKNGNIGRAEKFSISRFKNHSTKDIASEYACGYHMQGKHSNREKSMNVMNSNIRSLNSRGLDDSINLVKEDLVLNNINNYGSKIYFNKLRYFRNGHLISGCYAYINGYGFYLLDESVKDAASTFELLIDKPFSITKSLFLTNSKEDIKKADYFIPFPSELYSNVNDDEYMHFMYQGVNLSLKADYLTSLSLHNGSMQFDWEELSCCSKHPILGIGRKYVTPSNQNIMHDYKLFDGTISPLGSERIYTIVDGNCTEIKLVAKYSSTNQTVINLEEVASELKKEEEEKSNSENNDLLDTTIEEVFNNSYKSFPLFIKRLEKFKDLPNAKKGILILNDFMKATTDLITLEHKNN
jgi:hypothetical protein